MAHLFVDISSHGFGHLAQVAPILNALQRRQVNVRLTVRSALPAARLRARIDAAFAHLDAASDFGFVMHDAVRLDLPATLRRYRDLHDDWAERVAAEARLLSDLRPALVLTDVAYLPLAGAAWAGVPAWSMCSLNWADLFGHFFGKETDAPRIHGEILAAYRSAERFLRLTPAMPMADLPNAQAVAPVASLGARHAVALRAKLGVDACTRLVLVAYGGFDRDLGAGNWPLAPHVHWLIPQAWGIRRSDMTALESLGLPFTDLLASVDAVLTKPGYGTFTEAACNGTPVLYQRREDWPEQDCLIDWLRQNARCREVAPQALAKGQFTETLAELWAQAAPEPPSPGGASQVAALLHERLRG